MSEQLEVETQEEIVEPDVRDAREHRELPRPEVRTLDSQKHEPHQPNFKKSILREYFESAVVTLIMALFGMTFIVQAVKVPTGSMKNTIAIQDHLLVNKFIFGSNNALGFPVLPTRNIRRGDVVVFKYPKDPATNFVKRVIGLPGETVEYDNRLGKVFINGQELPENRIYVEPQPMPDDPSDLKPVHGDPAQPGAQWAVYYYKTDHESAADLLSESDAQYATRQPFKVPMKGDPLPDEIKSDPQRRAIYDADNDGRYDSDQYFCMGDNRDNSLDSRFWGTVPRSSIVGRAMFVYWSIDRSSQPDDNSNLIKDFFTKSRWSRTGKFIK
jgi:signal peptidase I